MWCWRRIGKMGGTDRVRNKVLHKFIEGKKRVEVAGR
jgi:hypothetical protein